MKKTKLMLFVLLAIGIFFLIPIKVFAQITPDGNAEDWYNYISQFDKGYATATVDIIEEWLSDNYIAIIIIESPENEFDGYYLQFNPYYDYDGEYFEPFLVNAITGWVLFRSQYETLASMIEFLSDGEIDDFDGTIYWNFEEKYWQIDYYNKSENNNKEVDMVTDLLETLADIGEGIGDLFGKIVESVGQFFYTPGTGDNPGSFTIIGILTIAAVVVSLSMWVLRLILRLFKLRG